MPRKYILHAVGKDGNLYRVGNFVHFKNMMKRANMHRAKGNAIRIGNRFTGQLKYLNPCTGPAALPC